MQPESTSLKEGLSKVTQKQWLLIAGAGAILLLIANAGGSTVDPGGWSCENLKNDVIEMSRANELEVLEIGEVYRENNIPNQEIVCHAAAEWSRGEGAIEYGAEVSGDGNIILSYRQR